MKIRPLPAIAVCGALCVLLAPFAPARAQAPQKPATSAWAATVESWKHLAPPTITAVSVLSNSFKVQTKDGILNVYILESDLTREESGLTAAQLKIGDRISYARRTSDPSDKGALSPFKQTTGGAVKVTFPDVGVVTSLQPLTLRIAPRSFDSSRQPVVMGSRSTIFSTIRPFTLRSAEQDFVVIDSKNPASNGRTAPLRSAGPGIEIMASFLRPQGIEFTRSTPIKLADFRVGQSVAAELSLEAGGRIVSRKVVVMANPAP